MRFHKLFIVIVLGVLAGNKSPASAQEKQLPERVMCAVRHNCPLPKWLKTWSTIANVGGSNHIQPFVYVSPQSFNAPGDFETVVTLPLAQYRQFVELTEAANCSHTGMKDVKWGTIAVAMHNAPSNQRVCVLHQPDACRYLAGLMARTDIHWTSDMREAVNDVGKELTFGEYTELVDCPGFTR